MAGFVAQAYDEVGPRAADLDRDGEDDFCDDCVDEDRDGVGNGALGGRGCLARVPDVDDDDPFRCADTDGDGCEDCASGRFAPDDDGDDADGDGICDGGDGCVDVENPGQADTDGDGIQDGCDVCPGVADAEQLDADGDGLGDACDDYHCVADGPEVCDGEDNDCNGLVDDGLDAPGLVCATGEPGRCAVGIPQCIGRLASCEPVDEATDEVCNGEDDDCDGSVDNGVRNACGLCGDVPAERCNGADDNCDGQIDEAADGLCDEGRGCREGRCLRVCVDGACARRDFECEQGLCVPVCARAGCDGAGGEWCNPRTGLCEDVCGGLDCDLGDAVGDARPASHPTRSVMRGQQATRRGR